MQRLVHLCTATSRLVQVVGNPRLTANALTYPKSVYISSLKSTFATKTPDVDPHAELYKASTEKEHQHIPDDLKGGQPPETFNTNTTPRIPGGKVWSAQHPEGVHIAPLGRVQSTKFVASTPETTEKSHETTVYTTKGEVNIADPFKTHKLQPEATPQQLAEAAAASAFEPFAPDTPPVSKPAGEAVFSPKISSTDVYSATTSPTAEFQSSSSATGASAPAATSQEPVKYETARKGKVYGGQDTSAETKKHPNENPFNLKEKINPRQAK